MGKKYTHLPFSMIRPDASFFCNRSVQQYVPQVLIKYLDEDANYKFSEKYPDGKQFFQVVHKPKVRPFWGSRMSHGVKVLATAAFHRLRQNAANACRVATRVVRTGGGSGCGLWRLRRPSWV